MFSLLTLFVIPSAYAIVGGVPASLTEVRGQVALVDVSRPDDAACAATEVFCKHYCSGVLIAPQWVLTAAHCADNAIVVGNLRVVAGTIDLYAADMSQAVGVVQKFVHPDYGIAATFNADIALLKLDTPLNLPLASLAEAQAFALLQSEAVQRNDEVRVAGWGRLSSTGGFPKTARRVDLDLQPDSVCESKYNQLSVTRYFASSMLCVMEDEPAYIENDDVGDLTPYDAEGEGVCNYDSGGPLSFWANGFWQVAGLTSFAPQGDCASSSLPSVFTRLQAYVPWVEETIKQAGDNAGDLALSVSGADSYQPGQAATITIRLKNASQRPSGWPALTPAPLLAAFTVAAPAAASLSVAGAPSGLNCVAVSAGWECTSIASMAPGAVREATFTVMPVAGEQVVDVSAQVKSPSIPFMDYRQGNDQREVRLVFSANPDLTLTLSGFSQALVNTTPNTTDGRIWVVGRLQNRSSLTAVNNVQLSLLLPAGYVFEAWEEGLDECSSQPCNIPSLAPGESRDFRVRLFANGAVAETVSAIATSTDGDFPVMVLGHSDTEVSVAVSFNVLHVPDDEVVVIPDDPAAPGVIRSLDSGGSLGWLELLCFVLLGGGARWRKGRSIR